MLVNCYVSFFCYKEFKGFFLRLCRSNCDIKKCMEYLGGGGDRGG